MAMDFGLANFYSQIAQTGYNTTMAFGNEITSGSLNRINARMNAQAYRSQARLNILAAQQQNAYLNEELGQNVWNNYANAREFAGSQRAAMAASGFADMSSGDYSLTRETALRADAVASGMNRSAYLQSFETEKQARMEASRLEYAARAQDIIRKQYSPLNSFINANFAAMGAFFQGAQSSLQSYAQLQQPGKNLNVDPVSGKVGGSNSSPVGTKQIGTSTVGGRTYPVYGFK